MEKAEALLPQCDARLNLRSRVGVHALEVEGQAAADAALILGKHKH